MGSLLKDFVDLAEGKPAINKFCCGVSGSFEKNLSALE